MLACKGRRPCGARGTPLLKVETEKITVVLEAEAGGVLHEVHAQAGDRVAVGAVVGLIDD